MQADNLPKIERGKRATVAGRTGSGKSTLARWLLERSAGRWIILNPKHTAAYDSLSDVNTLNSFNMKKLEKSMMDYKFTVLNPPAQLCTPEVMDQFIAYMQTAWRDIGLGVDELYSLHKNGQAGEGLTGWLTRGRELHQSFIGLTQRPSWVSKFLFSESDYIGEMSLNLQEDRKRMYEITGQYEMTEKLDPHYWLWYDMAKDNLRKFAPVPAN